MLHVCVCVCVCQFLKIRRFKLRFHSGKHIARLPSLDITLLQEMPVVVHTHTTGCVGVMTCVVIPQEGVTELYHSHVC